MGIMDLFKSKKRESLPHLEIPKAPPSEEELPELPAPQITAPEENVFKPSSSVVHKIESAAVKEQVEVLEERDNLSVQKPIFMSVEVFRDVVEENQLITHILKENEDTLVRVSQFKEDEDKEFKRWESHISNIQKKLIYVDKVLFGQSER